MTSARPTLAHWVAGARPRTLPAAVSPVLSGTGVAVYADDAVWWKAFLALVVALALQVGVNYANDYSDGVRGTDAERVGPLRLVGSGLVRAATVRAAAVGWFGGVGAVGVRGAWFYTGGRKPYGYSGWGEAAVFLFFGPVAVLGTLYVQIGRITPLGLLGAIAVGAFSAAVLVANNLRDVPTDRESGKRTLAVRLGEQRTRVLY